VRILCKIISIHKGCTLSYFATMLSKTSTQGRFLTSEAPALWPKAWNIININAIHRRNQTKLKQVKSKLPYQKRYWVIRDRHPAFDHPLFDHEYFLAVMLPHKDTFWLLHAKRSAKNICLHIKDKVAFHPYALTHKIKR